MRAIALMLLLALSVLAGCAEVDDPTQDTDGDPVQDAFRPPVTKERLPAATEDLSGVIDEDHGGLAYLHANPAMHVGSHGMELVGYNPLTRVTEGGAPLDSDSAYIAMDTWGHLVCVAHFAGSTGAFGGATIASIEDPTDPVVISRIPSAAVNSDCQFTDDGELLILATYGGAGNHLADQTPDPTGAVGSNGLSVYDMSDPSSPQFLFHDTQGIANDDYHNVFTATIDGTHYIFQTYSDQVLRINDDRSALEPVSQLEYSSHDLWVGQHPITGNWTVVTGAGAGTAVIDFEDPENPATIGVWTGSRDDRMTGWHRQWPVDGTIDGRAYIVVAGEECGNGDSLPYQVLDWTDPSAMEMTGSWWIPGKPANEAPPHLCEMNSHEFEVWDGYVATGNYHAGVWVFDVGSPERVKEPATIGYYLPSETPQLNGGTLNAPFVWSPNVWGAYFDERGYIVAADWWSGLYVLDIGVAHDDAHR